MTALVPTNQPIAALPDGSAILADPVAFESFLRSHTVSGSLTNAQIFAQPRLTTLNGDVLTIDPVPARSPVRVDAGGASSSPTSPAPTATSTR